MTTARFATAASLWRYPVKSMAGEEVEAAYLTERGILGDRAYALIDGATGKAASARHSRRWPHLLSCRAAFAEPPRPGAAPPPVRISLPDGSTVTSDESDRDRVLSKAMGREVRLATVTGADASGAFVDLAAVHLLTTATLGRLRELYPRGRFEARRFRPNLVVEPASEEVDFAENGWVGRAVGVGEEVRLRITGPCQRCVMTTLSQEGLPKDPGILRTAARHNASHVGVYAEVLAEGMIRRGDPLRPG